MGRLSTFPSWLRWSRSQPRPTAEERRDNRKDSRRVTVHTLAHVLAEVVPEQGHYETTAEFQAACGIWDDVQRAIASGLRLDDRRKAAQRVPAFSSLVSNALAMRQGL